MSLSHSFGTADDDAADFAQQEHNQNRIMESLNEDNNQQQNQTNNPESASASASASASNPVFVRTHSLEDGQQQDSNQQRNMAGAGQHQQSTSPTPASALPEYRFLLDQDFVPALIGKSGQHINMLRTTTQAQLQLLNTIKRDRDANQAPPPRNGKVMTIKGSNDQVTNVVTKIIQKMLADSVQPNTSSPPAATAQLRQLVHERLCGALIGRAGATVKSMMTQSGASIRIAGELMPQSTERCITMQGTQIQLLAAFECISQILRDTPLREGVTTKHYDPDAVAMPGLAPGRDGPGRDSAFSAPHQGGPGSGPNFSAPGSLAQQQQAMQAALQQQMALMLMTANQQQQPGGPNPAFNPMQMMQMFAAAQASMAAQSGTGAPGSSSGAPLPPQQHSANPSHTDAPHSSGPAMGDDSSLIQRIAIPSVCAGCVIGARGAVIGNIRRVSNCKVTLDTSSAEMPDERIVTLQGSQASIDTAVRMIKEAVDSYKTREPGARHSGGPTRFSQAKQDSAQDQDSGRPYHSQAAIGSPVARARSRSRSRSRGRNSPQRNASPRFR